ncbi:MAG: riboflavin synthase [Nitriliruptorales bacterium]|nr:riboflavin synthase [Nitriliruptorales bacterium]
MFTGIVEEIGTVADLHRQTGSATLAVACETVVADAQVGDSISVNGVCLTVTALTGTSPSTPPAAGAHRGFTAQVMGETLDCTGLGDLAPGAPVNLERALRADGRFGGHLVQGHVDGVAQVAAVEPQGDWTMMTFSLPPRVAPYVVEKGSITVDGTSLTVMAVSDGPDPTFSVGLIPHTLAVTVLGRRVVGDPVNLEVDVVAKYVERMLAGGVAAGSNQRGGTAAVSR